jgi:hypothetical protein
MQDREECGCPTPDEMQASIDRQIRESHYQVIHVGRGETTPSFTYTVGFAHAFQHPEIMIVGLYAELGHSLLSEVHNILKGGSRLKDWSQEERIIKNFPVVFRSLRPIDVKEHVLYAASYWPLGGEPEVLQMVLPNNGGQFPWDAPKADGFLDAQRWILPAATQ